MVTESVTNCSPRLACWAATSEMKSLIVYDWSRPKKWEHQLDNFFGFEVACA
jgi:hypothetical protein